MGVVIEWVWLFAGTNDTAKVEVWDVVDYGRSAKKKKNANASLKMSNDQSVDDMALDASSIDVYKGAHAVILVYDITKQWTWEYVEREINNVPFHIPVVVLVRIHLLMIAVFLLVSLSSPLLSVRVIIVICSSIGLSREMMLNSTSPI
jgi:GTPase SAR1 family protein